MATKVKSGTNLTVGSFCWLECLGMKMLNIHFICSSNKITALQMGEAISRSSLQLENNGIEVFDADYQENVLVFCPLMLIICDYPRASELVNHLGSIATRYCQMCDMRIFGRKEVLNFDSCNYPAGGQRHRTSSNMPRKDP